MSKTIDELKSEFHQLRNDDKDFKEQYDADEFFEWLQDYEKEKVKNFFNKDEKTQAIVNEIKEIVFGDYNDKSDFIKYIIEELEKYEESRY